MYSNSGQGASYTRELDAQTGGAVVLRGVVFSKTHPIKYAYVFAT